MSYGITDSGFIIKDFNTIKQELIILAQTLLGSSLDTRETNPTIVLLNIIASREQQIWNIINDTYSNNFIVSANGTALDALAIDRGLKRLSGVKATGTVNVVGSTKTLITVGDKFSTSGDNIVVFLATQTVDIGLTSEQFLTGIGASKTLLIQADGSFDATNPWVSIVIDGVSYTEVATVPELAANKFHCDYANPSVITLSGATASVVVTISYYDPSATNIDVAIEAEVFGTTYNVGINTIDTISSFISGASTVSNPTAITGGLDIESHTNFRKRLIESPLSIWTEAFLKSLVENISGVKSAEISDGIIIDTLSGGPGASNGQTANSTWWQHTLSKSTLQIFRVVFYDDSALTSYNLIFTTNATVNAGEYKLDVSGGATTTIQYRSPNNTGDLQTSDTLTVEFVDSTVGTGIFRIKIVPNTPPLTTTLQDTIESTIKSNKPMGVAFFVDVPTFSSINLNITLLMDTGYAYTDVETEIKNLISSYYSSILIGDPLRHAKLLDIAMGVIGVKDVSTIKYVASLESISKGLPQATDSSEYTIVDTSNSDGSADTVTDSDSIIYTQDINYLITAGAIDWNTGLNVANKRQSDNGVLSDTFNIFPSTPVALQDKYYFGYSLTFNMLKIIFSSASTVGTGTWEYWNGSWTALSSVVDGTVDFSSGASTVFVTFLKPTDWASTIIDSVTAFWIRYTLDTYASGNAVATSIQVKNEPAQNIVYTVTYDITTNSNVIPGSDTIVIEGATVIQE